MSTGNIQGWDPLEEIAFTDQEILSAAKKREIKNILKSYVSNYDPFSELLQNALDAVERRIKVQGAEFEPKIHIVIDLEGNSLEVIDNGCGFESNQFRSFLAPSISYKTGQGTRGNKGVGVTYVAYGFNDLIVRTKNSNFQDARRIKNGRAWVDDQDGTVSRPRAEQITDIDEFFDALDQGTQFKIYFGGDNTRPKSLAWYQASTANQWLYLLLVKTPLGMVFQSKGIETKIIFDLVVVNSDGIKDHIEGQLPNYKYPHKEISASLRLKDILETQKKAIEKGKDPSNAIAKYKNSNGVYEYFEPEELCANPRLSEEDIQNIKRYKIRSYGYFAYSTEVWDQLNDIKAKLRKKLRILKGGLQLANNSMVQGEMITIPLNKSIGHQNQAHILVHFEDAEPDLGRKGFQPELKELGEKIAVWIVNRLSARRDLLKSDSGAQADIEKDIKVHEWLRDQEDHEKENPLLLYNENFFLPTKKISINSVPRSEQDTIVLFNQLLAGGVIRGIKLLSTSQVKQYDGVFRYCADEPLKYLEFHRDTNPLGVIAEQLTKPYVAPPKILEYKYNLDGLIREFESGVKNAKDVDLAVFWEMGEEYEKEYTMHSMLDFDRVHQRAHHGLTHTMSSGYTSVSVVCLKELIQLLNDCDAAQAFQKERYSDDI